MFVSGNRNVLVQSFWRGSTINANLREAGLFIAPNIAAADSDSVLLSRTNINQDNTGLTPSDLTLEWEICIVPES